jgi:photosystem II stability/assembly factor-like uncharacterized protein
MISPEPVVAPRYYRQGRVAALVATIALAALVGLLWPEPTIGQTGQKTPPTDERIAERLGLTLKQVQLLHTERGMTNEMLADFPLDNVSVLYRKLARANVQRDRAIFRAMGLRDEKGVIHDGARVKAMEHVRSMHEKSKQGRYAGLPVGPKVRADKLLPPPGPAAPPAGPSWQAMGPTNVGGRTRTLVIHPQNANIMYAGAAAGGVWKTINGGQNWFPLSDLLANMAVSTMVMDPTNPEVLYVGTGEGFNNEDAVRGGGIFKTADGGATWQTVAVPIQQFPAFQYVNRLAMSSDGKVLMAAVAQGDRFNNLAPDAGIYISSDPGHSSWRQVLNANIGCVAIDPRDSSKCIASCMAYSKRPGDTYYSINGGNNWTLAPASEGWYGRVELCYARANSSVVYASVGQLDNNFNPIGSDLWRSSDGGRTYAKMDGKTAAGETVQFLGGFGWYANCVWAGDPTNANVVVVGGTNLWKSTDGGIHLALISDWTLAPASPHADHHIIVSHPQYDGSKNKIVFVGNDGGICRADDLTTTGTDAQHVQGWTTLDNNYVVTQFFGIAAHTGTGVIIGGTQDNGTHKVTINGDKFTWSQVWTGDGGYAAIDHDDPSYAYGEYTHLAIFSLSKDSKLGSFVSGFVVDPAKNQWVRRPAPYNIPDAGNPFNPGDPFKANFIAPYVLDPNNHNRMLAGGASLWVTNDIRTPCTVTAGPSWTQLKPPVAGTNYINAITVAKGDSNVIWIGHNASDIYVTNNGTAANPAWVRVDQALPSRMVTRIVIDPANHKHVFVTFAGYSASNLWETFDGGTTWRDISRGLPAAPFRNIVMHPTNSKFLYLATEVGLFGSEDGGNTWSPTNEGPTNCRVDDLLWMNNTLVAATHGRGIFRIDLSPH